MTILEQIQEFVAQHPTHPAVSSIVASDVHQELKDAYIFAYMHGITTMPSIEQADMDGHLIRAHMAKMLSQFAVQLFGKTPDTTRVCVFSDIDHYQGEDIYDFIIMSCQLGLM